MQSRRPEVSPSLEIRTTPEGLPIPLTHHEIEDPAEMQRLVAEWERTHGCYSHVLFECEAGILHAPRPVTSVLAPREQPVMLVSNLDRGCVHTITREMVATVQVRAENLPFFSWCLVPLALVTNVPGDLWRGVPMRKVGVNTIAQGPAEIAALLQAMDQIPDEGPPDDPPAQGGDPR